MQQLQNSSFRINFIAKIYHSIEMAFLQPLHSPVHNILSLLSKGIAVMMVLALPGDKKGLPFNNCPTKKWMGTQCPNIPQWMWWSWKSSLGHGCMAGVRERDSQCGAELALEDDGEKNENPPEVNISIICESFVISAPFLPHSSLYSSHNKYILFTATTKFNNKQS